MVIICERTNLGHQDSDIINNNLDGYIKVGAKYTVYGIRVSIEATYYLIFDGNHLIESPSELFSIIEHKVSPSWLIKSNGNRDFTIWPEIFYKKYFFEKFSEYENVEREEFNELKKKFECK